MEIFRNFDEPSVIEDFVFELFEKIWCIGILTTTVYDEILQEKRPIRTIRDSRILCKNCLVVRFGGYLFIGIRLSMILKSIFEDYGYGVDLALLWQIRIP